MLDLQANKDKFIQIFKGEIHREGADKLLNWLENQSDFFEMPATGQYTLSCKGGGCLHALHTFRCLTEMVAKYRETDPNFLLDPAMLTSEEERQQAITELDESIAIVGLLHDIGNANCWLETIKNVQVNGKWVKKPGYTWEEEFIYGHGAKAVYIIQSYMKVFVEEAQAIRFHSQGKEIPYGNNFEDTFYAVYETNPFAAIVGAAVNEATNVLDRIAWERVKPQE